ncbi:hypothetical protein ACFSKN_15075 [Mariniflexile gromovii]|uniref:Outer membrane protein with beta-barrel domain n=1 Tax=Mariniflexile gromovii TaxID=362523 RepID=A0ABS4C051_9FLAO|nr:hypothetical protein [Mariniflexile gromovii]MBP0905860.1 hypothetical protein [Mariniflexile gromovii]
MKKITLLLMFLICGLSFAQEFEIGPMFNYERTSFNIPDDSFIIVGEYGGEGSRTTGYESNFSFGVFGQFFLEERIAIAGELFYTKTTSTEFKDIEFTSINFIPYASLSLIRNGELYLNLGAGIAYMTKTPDFENEELNEKTKKFDFPIKLGLNYRFPKLLIIDVGIHSPFSRIVEDELLRTAYYLGIKIPLNQILNK